jgi:hypothetical protein
LRLARGASPVICRKPRVRHPAASALRSSSCVPAVPLGCLAAASTFYAMRQTDLADLADLDLATRDTR